MAVDWSYFDNDKFEIIQNKYLPQRGEGETRATQTVTAVCKLVYKWYNDGDVYDNTHYLSGWYNDLSTYANWLAKYARARDILNQIFEAATHGEYEDILKNLADKLFDLEYLDEQNKLEKIDSIYECEGPYRFEDIEDDDDEEDDYYEEEDE